MLNIKRISKKYSDYVAIHDLSLQLKHGEKCCLVGPIGSGKTTLLRLIAGFEVPDGGEIFLDGRLVSSEKIMVPPHERQVGMVFQNLAIWPHLNVLKHLLLVMNSNLRQRQRREIAFDILDQMGLSGFFKKYPDTLSGGQRQKLAIARMLASPAKIALCDEPYAHLDPASKAEVKEVVNQWLEERQITLIMVTHDPLEDLSLFDKVAILNQGSLVALDKPGVDQNLSLRTALKVQEL